MINEIKGKRMGNMLDYVKEFGKYSLREKPFNLVDSLILSQLTYLKYDGVMAKNKSLKKYPINELSHAVNIGSISTGLVDKIGNEALLLAVANCRRFRTMYLTYYVNIVDIKEELQFSALTFLLDDQTCFVGFRGTDETLIGWKEDFNMAFMKVVPAQLKAKEYLDKVMRFCYRPIRVGGHSKGGNLAVYAAMNVNAFARKSIINVYSYDGPGFKEDISKSKEYNSLKGKIQKVIPQSSVVGLLMQHQEEHIIIRSNQVGILQHDPFSWEIQGNDFVYVDSLDRNAIIMDRTLNEWLNGLSDEERKAIVDIMFRIIKASQMDTIAELKVEWKKTLPAILQASGEMEEESRKYLIRIMRLLMKSGSSNIRNFLRETEGIENTSIHGESGRNNSQELVK